MMSLWHILSHLVGNPPDTPASTPLFYMYEARTPDLSFLQIVRVVRLPPV